MSTTTQSSVQDVLQLGGKPRRRAWKKWFVVLLLLVGAGGAGWYFWGQREATRQPAFQTETVQRGNLSVSVTATGNLQPLNQVDIGTELSGTVKAVLVDNNDVVKKGQELARLDTAQLEDTITKSKAALSSSQANVRQASAGIAQAQATVKEARVNLGRLQQLYQASGGKLPAKGDLDTAKATLDRAQADVNSAKAGETAAKANVLEAQAALRSAQSNLGKAIITSPINGVVLDRAVEPGQTVAASLSAPTLFTLAEDLSKMELQVSVDEADVGQVKEGQSAEFTVDAWPGRKYQAKITRVSLGATSTDNVVSYVTDMAVENADLSLRPGMTATATITTDSRTDVLKAPNAALRFTPPMPAAPDGAGPPADGPPAGGNGGGILAKLMPHPPMMPRKQTHADSDLKPLGNSEQTVWALEEGHPKPIAVKTGITDGKFTEIVSGSLQNGMNVITGTQEAME